MPAASAASTPAAASSTTAQNAGGTPSSSAAFRKMSGAGLLRVTRWPSTTASSRSAMPRRSITVGVLRLTEPMPILMPAARTSRRSSSAPGNRSAGLSSASIST